MWDTSKPVRLDYVSTDGYADMEWEGEKMTRIRTKTLNIYGDEKVKTKAHLWTGGEKNKGYPVPMWSIDGSSTGQADTSPSTVLLRPVAVVKNPLADREAFEDAFLVLAEPLDLDGSLHRTNQRHRLEELCKEKRIQDEDIWDSIEQEFTIYDPKTGRPVTWPENPKQYPQQGLVYCGSGLPWLYGKSVSEAHHTACAIAGIPLKGKNDEVMPSQFEFQTRAENPLDTADILILARFMLEEIAGMRGLQISYNPKPLGKYNGAGAHIHFSTKSMREEGGAYSEVVGALEQNHDHLMKFHGHGNEDRLTGEHETAEYGKFRVGVEDRGATVRIHHKTATSGKGPIEYRSPAGNCDPYSLSYELFNIIVPEKESVAAEQIGPVAVTAQ